MDSTVARVDDDAHGLGPGLEGLRALMERLLGPSGCPWDREQTLETLQPYLIEEAHEVVLAMPDPEAHREELGDLLFQIVFQAALRERQGHFGLDGVIAAIREKMIRRHPHVFPQGPHPPTAIHDAGEVVRNWARIKAAERGGSVPDPLAGVPPTLPSLQRAWRLQDKAAAVGFDWPDIGGVDAKLQEEWSELDVARAAGDLTQIREELGDVLFVLVNLARRLGVEPEGALRGSIAKFEARFAYMMTRAAEAGLDPSDAGLSRLDLWWEEAKTALAAAKGSPPPPPGGRSVP